MRDKWAEERSRLNRHVFYEALKKTRDIGQQVTLFRTCFIHLGNNNFKTAIIHVYCIVYDNYN